MSRKVDMGGLFMEQRERSIQKKFCVHPKWECGVWKWKKESHRDFMRMK